MPKHENYIVNAPKQERKIHPIWRGVGFIFMVLIPIISYAAAILLLDANKTSHWLPLPYDLLAKPGELLYPLGSMIYIQLIVAVAIMLVLFALFSFVTFMINSMFGQSRYGPYDMPPVQKPRGVKMRTR